MTAPTPFNSKVNLISNGQPVDAGGINSPLSALSQRTISLQEAVTEAMVGSTVILREVPIQGTNVVAGMAVYKDTDGVFKPGLSSLELAPDGVTLQPASQSYIWGIVQYKFNSVNGNIVTSGAVKLTGAQLAAVMVDGVAHTGLLFLSATPGKTGYLTQIQPPIGITVGVAQGPDADGNYNLLINVGWKNPFEGHIHLFRRIANTISSTVWESAVQYESRTGLTRPTGGLYHYRHDQDAVLSKLWPPLPISAVHYDLDGVSTDLVNNTAILIDDTGIWWKQSSPALTTYRHDFYFTRMTFKTSNALVTSLRPGDSSVVIKDKDGQVATTGDLYITAELNVTEGTSAVVGSAIKEVDGLALKFGPVVDKIGTNTPEYVTITSTYTDVSSNGYGEVMIDILPAGSPVEGPIDFVDLDGVTIENFDASIFYLAFKQSQAGTILGRFQIPINGLPNSLNVYLDSIFYCPATGTMPNLTLSYLVVPNPALNTSTTMSTSFTSVVGGINLASTAVVVANDLVRKQTLLCTAAPGSIVYFKVTRSSTGGYSGDIGLMNQRWIVSPA